MFFERLIGYVWTAEVRKSCRNVCSSYDCILLVKSRKHCKEKISQIPKGLYRSEALIGGSWKNLSQKFAVCHPNSGEVISNVSDCQSEHVLEAVEASKSGFEMWKAKTAKERAAIVQKWGTLIDENQESLATVLELISSEEN